ncbi:ABC-F family ATP-binding cassette domain-containing protein [Edaphobacillus lindanitolerans]|uniref:ATP-binding cassette, subfamily F, uup n=1 Tax=Edaphobacillus lindanitolerans TaxID=550447 RepID=A0A1U7PPI3_9BACI|nr:ABC-F family ATP-binding cassette domain-containing protein [Edaphobacillus lindanitolerans]SIT80467.1 ATP-binding cassette, subfamily F, uup [Edaphobacillus lindanitolerans]
MSQLIVSDLTKTVGDKTLFKQINFTITSGDRIGLIGVNGTGKSTLLSIIAGDLYADEGTFDHPNDYRIVHLPQDPVLDPGLSVLQTVFAGDSPLIRLNREYENALKELSDSPDSPQAQERFAALQNRMDAEGGWDLNARAKMILSKLGLPDTDALAGTLSGGQQKRAALAHVLLEPADLLLLDEPTNHLDVTSIEWLQDYLRQLGSSLLFITHDRYFLDAVSTHIYELADRTLYSHRGSYSDFLEAKALRTEQAVATRDKDRNRYRNELKWIRRGAKARSTKQKARIGRFEELSEKVKKEHEQDPLDLSLMTSRLGKKVLEGERVTKRYGGRTVIDDFSFLLQGGDRIAVIGPNGAGKSTLMNILSGHTVPDSGELLKGETVRIAHFTQHLPEMDEGQRIIEYVTEASNDIARRDGARYSAVQMLEQFLFPSNVHGTLIGKLSGGERKRLYLLRLLIEQPNVLLLDEPTNDLDLETLSVLEGFIDTFPGVVVTISHDRFFLDRTSRKLWILDGSGLVKQEIGIYSDYLEKAGAPQIAASEKSARQKSDESVPEKPKKKKMTLGEKEEWEEIAGKIEEAEQAIMEAEEELAGAGSDYGRVSELSARLDEINTEYERLIERWSYLEDLAGGS